MNNTVKFVAIPAVAFGIGVAAYLRVHENIIVARFHKTNEKVVRKAYRIMMRRALAGAYADMSNDEDTMDAILIAIVEEITNK